MIEFYQHFTASDLKSIRNNLNSIEILTISGYSYRCNFLDYLAQKAIIYSNDYSYFFMKNSNVKGCEFIFYFISVIDISYCVGAEKKVTYYKY